MKRFVDRRRITLVRIHCGGAAARNGSHRRHRRRESGAPLSGVIIKAKLPNLSSMGAIQSTSDDKGDRNVGGMAKGEWEVDFEKPGYATRDAKVILPVELARVPPIAITLKKTF